MKYLNIKGKLPRKGLKGQFIGIQNVQGNAITITFQNGFRIQ